MKIKHAILLSLSIILAISFVFTDQSKEIAIRNLTKKVVFFSIKPSQASSKEQKIRIEPNQLERFSDGTSLIISFESRGQSIVYRLDPGMAYSFRDNEDGYLELYEGSHGRTDAPDLAPYVPTPMVVVEKMLQMAKVKKTDILYDLGCGDGRIVITAAKKYGIRGVGIDLDPERIKESEAYAKEAGVEGLVEFRLQDAMKSDISEATIVTLYLLPESNALLRPILEQQLKPGARVVSHNYHMPDWQAQETGYEEVTTGDGDVHTIFVYKIGKKDRISPPDRFAQRFPMIVREILAKSILNKSKIFDYCLNPYTGCQTGCRYCYARLFMPRYSGHKEPWGEFVDVKVNAVELLTKQLERAKKGTVWISSVCDPYQSLEKKYRLTRGCLEELLKKQFPVNVQTKSKLILRDLDILKRFAVIDVGFTIATDDERVARLFEPQASAVTERIRALETIRRAGIRTFAFIGPLLPGNPEKLAGSLAGKVDYVYIDRMNYIGAIRSFYQHHGMERALKDTFFREYRDRLVRELTKNGTAFEVLFSG